MLNKASAVLAGLLIVGAQGLPADASDRATAVRGMTLLASKEATASGAAQTEDSSLPKTVQVLGETLTLKENKRGAAGEFIAEYIPADQTWDNWTLMYAVRLIPDTNLDPEASATSTAQRILETKKNGDPVANAAVFKQNDGKSCAVDFVVSGPKMSVIEHNIFLYFKAPKGLVSQQVARRLYPTKGAGDNEKLKAFFQAIPQLRGTILKEMATPNLPITKFAK